MLDNEAQAALKRKTTVVGFICDMVPPEIQRENIIEQEIQELNDNFLLGLCISNTNCTM